MMIDPTNSAASPVTPVMNGSASSHDASGADFRQALLEQLQSASSTADTREAKAQKAAQQFVSSAFIMPLLKQMRQSPFKSQLMSGGQGEDAFGPQLDQILSDRIVQRMGTPESIQSSGSAALGMSLVDAVYRRIMRTAQARSAGLLDVARDTARKNMHTTSTLLSPPEMDLHG
jgi:hypothetical protein